MYKKLFAAIFVISICAQFAFSQTVETNKKDEIPADVKKEAVAFLRETSADVNNLRTLENRISFSAEIAGLMWFDDEKEARAMFQIVINDFRQLLIDYDGQLNSLGVAPELSDVYSRDSGAKAQITRKFYKAFGVRQQIATAIAFHDPELAFNFYTETGTVISNPTFRKQIEGNDVYFETRLLNQIAAKNVDAALKYGRKTLAKGFNAELINVLKKIYEKDDEKGAAFGEDIAAKLKSDASNPESFYYVSQVLSIGIENLDAIKGKPNKRPMFSESSLRDLSELLAQEILKREDAEGSELLGYLPNIERFSPARAAQIRQKFDIKNKVKNATTSGITQQMVESPPAPVKPEQEAQKQLSENLQNLGDKKLSDDDRKKVVEESKKIIAETSDRETKFAALNALAVQVAKLGDKELAQDLMNDVRSLTNLQPKNYRDYLEIWMLVSGYSQVDTDKAFPILEDTIFRLNDTISAFVKVGEFIDITGDIIDDGEIQVGSFGGDMTRDILRGLGASDTTVRNLAVADFTRTKNLAGKFERPEVRILAKMLILQAVLAKNEQSKEDF
ncbi:MAG: hypothetical protein ACR2HG_08180 [Pyrinomonadaceae bacterium]